MQNSRVSWPEKRRVVNCKLKKLRRSINLIIIVMKQRGITKPETAVAETLETVLYININIRSSS